MGGHGGLNILPQKRWNVYNYENREKVHRDKEAAAKEEQLKHEQARKQDAEFRLEQLRAARGLAPVKRINGAIPSGSFSKQKSGSHINLFEGIKIFDPLDEKGGDEKNGSKKNKMTKEEATTKVVTTEDEKYRLGYGVAGKGVKLPWYLQRRSGDANVNANAEGEDSNGGSLRVAKEEGKKSRKKTVEELREERLKRERLKRERREKERECGLLMEKSRRDGGFSKEREHSRRV